MTSRHVVKLYIKTRLRAGLLKSDSHLGIIYDTNLIFCHTTSFFLKEMSGILTVAKGNSLPCMGLIDNVSLIL